MAQVCDVEKLGRKQILEKVSPHEYFLLYSTCQQLKEYLALDDERWLTYLNARLVLDEITDIQAKINTYFDVSALEHIQEIEESCHFLIRQGIDESLDESCRNKLDSSAKFKSICLYLNGLYQFYEKKC